MLVKYHMIFVSIYAVSSTQTFGNAHPVPSTRKSKERSSKISSVIYPLLKQQQASASNVSSAVSQMPPELASILGVINSMIPVDVTASSSIPQLSKDLKTKGCIVKSSYSNVVSALCPLPALEIIGNLATVKFLRPVLTSHNGMSSKKTEHSSKASRVLTGRVISEGVKAMNAGLVQDELGFTGKDVKIGVLSDSYNYLNGAAADITSGDLPPEGVVVVEDYLVSGSTDEGRAMLQIIHDVAPKAKLYFHTAYGGAALFASGILLLARYGCDIIVDDVYDLLQPVFQDGIIAQAVDQVHNMGVAYFSSAGNFGRQSWMGPFSGITNGNIYGETVHNFRSIIPTDDPRIQTTIPIVLNWPSAIIVFDWDQPFFLEALAPLLVVKVIMI